MMERTGQAGPSEPEGPRGASRADLVRVASGKEGCSMSHGQGEDSGAEIGFSTARGRDWPSVRQFNVFVPNRVGGLHAVVRRFESSENRIVSLTVVDTADCAIIRLVIA